MAERPDCRGCPTCCTQIDQEPERLAVQRDAEFVEAAVVVILHERDGARDTSALTGTVEGPLGRDEDGSDRSGSRGNRVAPLGRS